ncbi:protein hedgehog [Drosophila subpulchrella]|uniref:protein hedgehog n=1 Tax=Drosophila subpulchrella TaxID=1486046 RepID=UPI0018A164CA|nr:protein hedgehog [Drosophila subpulchrella]
MDNSSSVPWASAASVTCLSLDAKCHSSSSKATTSSISASPEAQTMRHIAHTQRCLSRLTSLVALLLLVIQLNFTPAHSCGPGRGLGRHRARNLYPLVLKQTIPNLSEYTNSASGPVEGVIRRDSPKFKDLVPNYNRDILFRDEEGTGADRLMSKRCKEKLNVLAYSVMNEWPGIRLLVTESWDEEYQHGQESLHYEGRAVTIATSDRDQSKYGMLARLAVEAGFDWVSYVSRRHIYCSVKSDSSISSHVHGCFTPESTALLESGVQKPLGELSIGDRVLSMAANGQAVFSEVILFMDRNLEQMQNFVELHTDGGAVLTVTPAHLVSVWQPEHQDLTFVFADRVVEQNQVLVRDAKTGELRPQRVVRVGSVRSKGVVAPLTREGTIVVNSVAASCYAVINSQSLAHWGLAPMRLLSTVEAWLPAKDQLRSSPKVISQAEQQNGIHWYANALYKVKDYVLPQSWRHD